MSKKLVSLLLVFSLLLCLSACSSNETNKENDDNNTAASSEPAQMEEISSETESIQSEVTTSSEPTSSQELPEAKISESCNKILASGYDANENFYELVANEKEDYLGTTIEIGVIKNNKWSVPLTTKAPFIGETGLLVGQYSIYDEFPSFDYVGAGCFYYNNIIWNGNTNKTYTPTDGGMFVVKRNSTVVNNDGLFLIEKYNSNFKILYANTMSVKEISLCSDLYFDKFFPISEGLFAGIGSYDVETNGFYDINGKKIIDLSKYKLTRSAYGYADLSKDLIFANGECTFTITNDQGTEFDITIDKTGKVINSVRK